MLAARVFWPLSTDPLFRLVGCSCASEAAPANR
jgi:hypothetical protein